MILTWGCIYIYTQVELFVSFYSCVVFGVLFIILLKGHHCIRQHHCHTVTERKTLTVATAAAQYILFSLFYDVTFSCYIIIFLRDNTSV